MPPEVIRAQILMLIPTFLPTELEPLVLEQAIGLKHAQLAMVWIKGMFLTNSWTVTSTIMVRTISVQLAGFSLGQADYYPSLVNFLQEIDSYARCSAVGIGRDDMERTEAFVLDYLQVGIFQATHKEQMLIVPKIESVCKHIPHHLSCKKPKRYGKD